MRKSIFIFVVFTFQSVALFGGTEVPPVAGNQADSGISGTIANVIAGLSGADRQIILTPGTYTFSSNYTVPNNIQLVVEKGAVIEMQSCTLWIGGTVQAGAYQIFDAAPGEVIMYRVSRRPIQWWNGDCGDGSTDCAEATRCAIQSVTSALSARGGAIIDLSQPGNYVYDSQVDIDKGGIVIEGIGGHRPPNNQTNSGTFVFPGANINGAIFRFKANSSGVNSHGCQVRNLTFEGSRTYSIDSAIHLYSTVAFKGKNLMFSYLKGSGIKTTIAIDFQLSDVTIYYCGDTNKPSMDIDSAATGLSQAGLISNCRIEVSHSAPNLYVGSATRACHFSNIQMENSPDVNDIMNSTELVVAGFKNSFSGVGLNSHYGDDPRMIVTGSFNTFNGINIGSLTNGDPACIIQVDGGDRNAFSDVSVREQVAAAGGRYIFAVENTALFNTFSNLALNSYGGIYVDSSSDYNVICNITAGSSYEKIINFAGHYNIASNIIVAGCNLTSGDLFTLTGSANNLSLVTAYSISGVTNVVTASGNADSVTNCKFVSITNTALNIAGNNTIVDENSFVSCGTTIADSGTATRIVPDSNHGLDETVTGSVTLHHFGVSKLDSASGPVSATLPNGKFIGQRKIIGMSDATNSSTVSVTLHETSNPEVFTFDSTLDYLILEWQGNQWVTIKASGVAF